MTAVLFPMRLTMPDGTVYAPVKVFTQSPDGTRVYAWPDGVTAELVARTDAQPSALGGGSYGLDVAGLSLTLDPAGGCGCGHPGRRFSPPAPVRHGT